MSKVRKYKTKTKSPALELFAENLEDELRDKNRKISNDEIEFYQNYSTSQLTLQQFLQIQDLNLDIGFISDIPIDLQLNNALENNVNNLFSTDFYNSLNDIELSTIDYKTFHNHFSFNNSIDLSFNQEESSIIPPDNVKSFPYSDKNLRSGLVYNTGGFPLQLEWLPFSINNKKFLFIVTIDKNPNIDISEFSKNSCCLTILEYNNDSFEINKKIIIDNLIKEIEFSIISNDKNETLMKLTLSNGSVEIWKINESFLLSNNSKYYKLLSGSQKIIINNDKSIKITTSTFVTPKIIIFGTNHGLIGQYSILENKINYLISTKLPSITCIKSTYPTNETDDSINLLVSTTDFIDYMINLPLTINNKKIPLMNRLKIYRSSVMNRELIFDRSCTYINSLKTFFSIEWPCSIKSYTIKDPKGSNKYRISIDREISCLTNLKSFKNNILNNGFTLITGHTNGVIRLCNFIEMSRITDSKQYPYSIQLFQMKKSNLQNNNNNKFFINLNYSVDKNGDVSIKDKLKKDKLANNTHLVNSNDICPIKISSINKSIASAWGNGLIIIEDLII